MTHSRIAIVLLSAATIVGGCLPSSGHRASAQTAAPHASLAGLYRDDFHIGRALDFRSPHEFSDLEAYAKFFEIFQKHKDVIDRVTFWGLNDARSWRRGQAPLLFDGENKSKPALDAIVAAKK
jgi:hypothetical protein